MKKRVGAIIAMLVLVAGVAYVIVSKDKAETTNTNSTTTQTTGAQSTPQTAADTPKPAEAATVSSYITIDEYNQNIQAYTDVKKVLFFHAPWCPICSAIDKEIVAAPSKIPSGTTIIKTDYDKNTALRQKYGVTYQYTFVQIDNDGKQLKKWSATSLDKVLAQVQ
jgi:hypothetical protein